MIRRVSLAGAVILLAALAALVAGPAGAIVTASVAVAFAGFALRSGYVARPEPLVDLPDRPAQPTPTAPRLERLSGQLSIGMSDGIYFDRVVRPELARIAPHAFRGTGTGDVGRSLGGVTGARPAPTLRQLDDLVHRMERP